MQLKIKRSQKDGGMLSKTVIFCLDARAELTDDEQNDVKRYKLGDTTVYNSEASKRNLAAGDARVDGSTVGHLKAIAFYALAGMNLNITVNSLQRGQHIECKSLDEVIAAEEALMEACRNLKAYLKTADTFDGREAVVDFDDPRVANAV